MADVYSEKDVTGKKVENLETEVKGLNIMAESYKTRVVELREEVAVAKDKASEFFKALEKEQEDGRIREEELMCKVSLLETTISSLKEELEHAEHKSTEASALIESRTKEYSEKVDPLENNILQLQHELEVVKSKETDAHELLATKTREFTDKFQERDTHFSSLQEELEAAKCKAVEAAERLEIEKESFDCCTKELTEKIKELMEKVQLLENQLQIEDDKAGQAAQIYKDDEEGIILFLVALTLLF